MSNDPRYLEDMIDQEGIEMKKKCKICGKVEETYVNSPNHILGLCDEHYEWFKIEKAKQQKGEKHDLPLWLL